MAGFRGLTSVTVWIDTVDPLFLNTEGNEGKTGTGIKIRKAGKQERMKTSNSKPQVPSVQTPTVADDEVYLFITREYDSSGLKENGTIPF